MSVTIIVCGGRDYSDRARVFSVLDRVHRERTVTRLIQGGARGADKFGCEWAAARGVESIEVAADWSLGRRAGPMRNSKMLELLPDGVIAFPGGAGTQDMIRQAMKAGVPVMAIQL